MFLMGLCHVMPVGSCTFLCVHIYFLAVLSFFHYIFLECNTGCFDAFIFWESILKWYKTFSFSFTCAKLICSTICQCKEGGGCHWHFVCSQEYIAFLHFRIKKKYVLRRMRKEHAASIIHLSSLKVQRNFLILPSLMYCFAQIASLLPCSVESLVSLVMVVLCLLFPLSMHSALFTTAALSWHSPVSPHFFASITVGSR